MSNSFAGKKKKKKSQNRKPREAARPVQGLTGEPGPEPRASVTISNEKTARALLLIWKLPGQDPGLSLLSFYTVPQAPLHLRFTVPLTSHEPRQGAPEERSLQGRPGVHLLSHT